MSYGVKSLTSLRIADLSEANEGIDNMVQTLDYPISRIPIRIRAMSSLDGAANLLGVEMGLIPLWDRSRPYQPTIIMFSLYSDHSGGLGGVFT